MKDVAMYATEPLSYVEDIPVFSQNTDYIQNYQKIAADHMESIGKTGENPFIAEDLWVKFEEPTIQFVRKYAKPGQKILDAGVGLGRVLSKFPDLDRFGIDISLEYLKKARAAGIEVCFALLEDMPYRKETFDLVTCTDTLEHVQDLNLCCAKILGVLKKGGIAIFRIPYRESLKSYLDPSYPYAFAHLRTFDEYSLELFFTRIMRCQVLEMTKAGHMISEDRLRYRLRVPKWEGIVFHGLRLSKTLCPPLHYWLIKRLYRPVEINVVVRKT